MAGESPGHWLTFRLFGDLGCAIDLYLEDERLQSFLEQLASVEERRTGRASLVAEQVTRLTLTISVVDKLGHVALTVEVTQPTFVDRIPFENQLVMTTELDPGILPQLHRDFRAFAASLAT